MRLCPAWWHVHIAYLCSIQQLHCYPWVPHYLEDIPRSQGGRIMDWVVKMYYASEGKELVGCEALNHQQVVWLHRTTIAAFSLCGAAEAELLSLPRNSQRPSSSSLSVGKFMLNEEIRRKGAPTKEALKNGTISSISPIISKTIRILQGSLHMIHGLDVARAILAVHAEFSKAQGQQWIITDGSVYDWWDLGSACTYTCHAVTNLRGINCRMPPLHQKE